MDLINSGRYKDTTGLVSKQYLKKKN